MTVEQLRANDMMAHLLDSLDQGTDIGHYGRLVFAMVGHHFLDTDELVDWLSRDKSVSEAEARALALQVEDRDYSPPKRERILEWQAEQDFRSCRTPTTRMTGMSTVTCTSPTMSTSTSASTSSRRPRPRLTSQRRARADQVPHGPDSSDADPPHDFECLTADG